MRPHFHDWLALAAGAAFPFAFAPFGWWPLALVSLAVLFYGWSEGGAGRSAWRGFLFGAGMFGVGISWVYVSIHTFGNMSVGMSVLTVVLFAALMALYPALAGLLQGSLRPGAAPRLLLVLPSLWVLAEWLRGWLFTGFPWLNLGYAFIDTPLAGFAPVGGMYLVGLVAAFTAGALALLFRGRPRRLSLRLAGVLAAWMAGAVLRGVAWFQPVGEPVKVALVQENIPIGAKWDPDRQQEILAGYLDASRRPTDPQLVVWPEAAVPGYVDRLPEAFWQALAEQPGDFLFGALERRREGERVRLYNTVVSVGEKRGYYRKQHLVPFGEFFPLQSVFGWLFKTLEIPMSDFAAWPPPQPPLELAGQRVSLSICYEDAFPEEWRRSVPASTLLANVSEDAWFGDSLAPHQRLQMARFRAMESGRPMLRASNSGLSSLIDAGGRVVKIAPQFEAFVLEGEVQPTKGITPYVRFGNLFAIVSSLLLLVIGLYLSWKETTRR